MFAAYAALVFVLPEAASQPQLWAVWTFRNAYVWLALCAILGWGHALLNRPFRWLPWANDSVYPWYMLHQSLIIGLAYLLLPMHLGPVMESALVLAGTVAGCAVLTAFVRRIPALRPCFGLKMVKRPGRTASRAGSIANAQLIP
jgi:peptidoglycan/LPS O-acetylase OafA/YrhL